jgi:hypothetical protein
MINKSININKEVTVRFVDNGGLVNHHCLEVTVRFVDNGGLVNHHCLEVIVRFVNVGETVTSKQ